MAEDNEKVESTAPKAPVDMKMLIVFGVVIVVAVFVATIAVNKLIAPPTANTTTSEAKSEAVVGTGTSLAVGEDIITNLADKDDSRYVKIKISLELSDSKLTEKEKAKELVDPVRNTVLQVLRKKTSQDVKGTEGFNKLRKELKDELNKNVFKGKLIQVNISDFVVQ